MATPLARQAVTKPAERFIFSDRGITAAPHLAHTAVTKPAGRLIFSDDPAAAVEENAAGVTKPAERLIFSNYHYGVILFVRAKELQSLRRD